MRHTAFDRPGPESGSFDPHTDGDRAILMPTDGPIGIRPFVEGERTDRARARAEEFRRQSTQGAALSSQTNDAALSKQPRTRP